MTQEYYPLSQLAHAYPELDFNCVYKQSPEDFQVDEVLPFEPGGGGEHAWLRLRKRDCNTDWVAGQLAAFAGVKRNAVSYAGLKDRFAVTTQWFSVHLPGRDDVDWQALQIEGIELLSALRHSRKLQRGALKQNRFTLRLTAIQGDRDAAIERCGLLAAQGVPNYFGEQRFGRGMQNLPQAERMFANPRKRLPRHKRSLYLSAARSWLFNEILSRRIGQRIWNRRIPGDVFMLEGSRACFMDDASDELDGRLLAGEIHPTAVMWGEGDTMARGDCADLEASVIDAYPEFRQGLVDARVEAQRRSLRLSVGDMSGEADGDDLVLKFTLPAGAYATVVLREMGVVQSPAPGLQLPESKT